MTTKKFFYTTDTPYQWSSGPTLHFYNDEYKPIASIEEAEELALVHLNVTSGDDCVYTAFGVMTDIPQSVI